MFYRSIMLSIGSASKKEGHPSPKVMEASGLTKAFLMKSLAKYLVLEDSSVSIRSSAMAYWKINSSQDEFIRASTPKPKLPNSSLQGMLMYRMKSASDNWNPGFFEVGKGYLSCYSDQLRTNLTMFAFLCNNNCKRCRRLANPDDIDRPYVIELVALSENRLETIYMAASNEEDVTLWMKALFIGINISHPDVHGLLEVESEFEKFCQIVITEDSLFSVTQFSVDAEYSVIGYLNLSDIVAAACGSLSWTSFCYLVLELDSAENANASFDTTHEWIFYFTTEIERQKFISSLSNCWEKLFQVSLPVSTIDEENEQNLEEGQSSSAGCSRICDNLKRLHAWHANCVATLNE